jgi:DNA-binding IclR family transcriptional regulator
MTFKSESSIRVGSPLAAGRRSLQLIELIGTKRGGASFSALAATLDISAASLTRLLRMLQAEDWIRHEDHSGLYIAGYRLLQLGDDMRGHNPIVEAVAPIIYDLSQQQTGHSACFATYQGDCFTLLAKTEQRRSYHFIDVFTPNFDWIGNAMGQFLLAFQPSETVERIYREHFRLDVPAEHREGFAIIRATGTLVRTEGFVTRIIAGAVLDPLAPVSNLVALAALSADSPDVEPLVASVKAAAAQVEWRLAAHETSVDRRSTIALEDQ